MFKNLSFTKKDSITGFFVYALGDTIATLINGQFHWSRVIGMALVGASIYAFEIPNYFRWIEKHTSNYTKLRKQIEKTLWSLAFFNPLWIARHLFFIYLFTGMYDDINLSIFSIALSSFLMGIPISIIGNYVIQNLISLKYRFLASAIFSGLMAVYYALSVVWFKN